MLLFESLSIFICWTEQASGSALGCFSAFVGVVSSFAEEMIISLPNVKDEPRRQPARLLRQQEA